MGDRLWAGKLYRYVTSQPGQLSLDIPLWVGEISTSLSWKGNRRSGVALAMCHRHSGLSTYGLNGLWKGDQRLSTPPTLLRSMPPPLTSSWLHLRCDVGLEEGEYKWKLSRCYSIVYYYNSAQRYEQFLQVGWLYRALILLGLALCLPSASVSLVLMVLYRY